MNVQQAIAYLETENAQLRAEVKALRRRLHDGRGFERRIERAYDDALLLSLWWAGGIYPSRRYARVAGGMSQRAWQNAMALLRMARIVTGQRRWMAQDAALIEQRLQRAKAQALADPERFWLRLNRHGRR